MLFYDVDRVIFWKNTTSVCIAIVKSCIFVGDLVIFPDNRTSVFIAIVKSFC